VKIEAVELRLVGLPLVRPFRTSFGVSTEKVCILTEVWTADAQGWGECVADAEPGFSEEFNEGAWLILRDHLVPALLAADDASTERLADVFAAVRGNPMAKAALIDAVLDAELRAQGTSLAAHLGAERDRVTCGVSVGIASSTDALLEQVAGYLDEGYQRIKLKIAPGIDVAPVTAVREAHPDIALSVDANAAYRLDDLDIFRELDRLGLLMIEQPLRPGDLVDHARLQEAIETDICLDESIRSDADTAAALELGSCHVVNIKQGRMGGVPEAAATHDRCFREGVPVWCGGMLETGIGRAVNLALAALPGFTLPGDTSASSRYFEQDLTEPFVMDGDGTMAVPSGPGIGVKPDRDRLERCTLRCETIRP
jgi:O-succinylbenzoate synthase